METNLHIKVTLKFNIKTMKKLALLILLGGITFNSSAQQDEQMSMYLYNKLYYNPAYAGSRDAISAVAIARFQWVQFDGAPNTQWFSIHAPLLHKSLGVGAHMVNDRIGNRSRTAIYGDLSGSVGLNKKGDRLAAGVSGGIDMLGYDFSDVQVNDQADMFYGASNNVNAPNLGAGLYYYGNRHYVSLSVPRLIQSINKNTADSITQLLNTRHFFLSGGYVFDLNSVFKLQPSTMIKFTPNAPITVDVNATLLMYDQFGVGLMYRYNESMGANFVYHLKQLLSVGYTYDFPINGLRTYQYGSHEVFLRYDFGPKKKTYTSPRYF